MYVSKFAYRLPADEAARHAGTEVDFPRRHARHGSHLRHCKPFGIKYTKEAQQMISANSFIYFLLTICWKILYCNLLFFKFTFHRRHQPAWHSEESCRHSGTFPVQEKNSKIKIDATITGVNLSACQYSMFINILQTIKFCFRAQY